MRLLRHAPQKGVALLLIVILVCSTAMVGILAYLGAVAAGAARVHHQRDTVQAIYAAESGVELAIALANSQSIPAKPVTGCIGSAFYTTSVTRDGAALIITSDGLQQRPGRADLIRRIEAHCRIQDGTWKLHEWKTLPPPETITPHPIQTGPEVENS